MVRKNTAFEEKGSSMGHNKPNDASKMDYVKKFCALNEKLAAIRGEQKDLLNQAKDGGHLKTSIRNAAKILGMTEEQYQSKKEIESETQHIIKLFADSEGQYSFLSAAA